MRITKWMTLVLIGMICSLPTSYGGGSVGLTPGSGIKVIFADGGKLTHLPVGADFEINLGKSQKHSLGAAFSYDIGLNSSNNFFSIRPTYKYYISPRSSSFYIGASTDFQFKEKFIFISPDIVIGFQVLFNDKLGLFADTNAGYTIFKNNNQQSSKTSGFNISARLGFKFLIGN